MRQGSVDCESFRSLSIGVPFCFKLPAYPLRSSPSSVSSSIACPASLYLSLYPRIASVAIITALKEYTRRVIPALCEDSHRDVYVYPSTLSPSLSLSTAHSSPVTPLSPPRYRSTPLSGSSPLFVTAVSPLKHCVPSLSLSLPPSSPPSPPLAPSAGRSRRSFAPSCRLRYVSRYDSPSRPSSPILLRVFLDDGSEETVQRPHSFPNWDAYVCAD